MVKNNLITPIDNSFKKAKTETTDIFFDNSNKNISHISTEIEKFVTSQQISRKLIFGRKSPVYRQFSLIPASNSSVERAFSQCKYIFDYLSRKLSDENIEAQLMACII